MNRIYLIIGLVALFFLANHMMDLGMNMKFYKMYDYCSEWACIKGTLGNGFITLNASQVLHIAWYVSYACFIVMTVLALKRGRDDRCRSVGWRGKTKE